MHLLFFLLNKAKNIMKIYLSVGGYHLAWLFIRASGFFRKGKYRKAVDYFQAGLDLVDRSRSRKLFKVRQLWQFNLERVYYYAGQGRVVDPLFSCELIPANRVVCGGGRTNSTAGIFEVEWAHLGLRIDGLCNRKNVKHVELLVDDRPLRKIPIIRWSIIPGYFYFHIKREVIELFPKESVLKISISSGEPFLRYGQDTVSLRIPHGSGKLFTHIDDGAVIDKKGFFSPTLTQINERQEKYLRIYKPAAKYYMEQLKTPLFLMYGTLLGFYRNGDFITGDDDFDAGWISNLNSASEVKEETKQIVVDLVLAGFTCSFNRSGRLFRLRLSGDLPGIHLDVRPLWYEDNRVWAHKQACLPLKLDDFVPAKEGELRGVKVHFPRNPESFLEAYYGKGWKVPDPAYSNASAGIPNKVIRKLDSVCITPVDYREMVEEIESLRSANPNAGKLISAGAHSLYPLEEYESNCEW